MEREADWDVVNVMDELYGMIMDELISKGAEQKVLDRTWNNIGHMITTYVTNPTEANEGYILVNLREKYWNLLKADNEKVQNLKIFLTDYKKPEFSHLEFEEGGLRNVDEYEIKDAA